MGAVVLALTWACATGIITTASRMTWSFARDRGLPFSTALSKVSKNKRIPVAACLMATGFACLLTLIYVGSYTAFNDVVSLTITGFYCSYLLPAAFLLKHRIRGTISAHRNHLTGISEEQHGNSSPVQKDLQKETEIVDATGTTRRKFSVADTQLTWGPFHLPGMFGIINNAYACVYMVFVIFWSFWPPQADTNYENMNYAVVVVFGVIIFSIIWYFVRGRKEYSGPTVDEEVEVDVRRASVTA